MATNSGIEWTESTWNPWSGCAKVSPGCKYCYMHRIIENKGGNGSLVTKNNGVFEFPLLLPGSRLIFTCSMSDWFIEEADKWRDEAWKIIHRTPQHTYQILTKRPERIKECLPTYFSELKNVWIGVSVESQEYVDRLEYLMDLPCVKFASFEPLLGPIKWDERMSKLDWSIIGGESGYEHGKYRYRPMELEWAYELLGNAWINRVPCFVKQLGTFQYHKRGMSDKKGGNISDFPPFLRIRQYPKGYDAISVFPTQN